jgi:hypothetical protein
MSTFEFVQEKISSVVSHHRVVSHSLGRGPASLGIAPGAVVMQTENDSRYYKNSSVSEMAAVEAAQRGDWRACVDGYQRAFKESGGPASTFTNRYFVVSGFTAPLRDGSCAPLKSDFKLLTTLIDDEDEQPEIRMQAALTKGMLKWDSNDRDGAARYYRKCVDIGDAATETARGRVVLAGVIADARGQPKPDFVSAGTLCDQIKGDATINFNKTTARSTPREGEGAIEREGEREDGSVDWERTRRNATIRLESSGVVVSGRKPASREANRNFRIESKILEEAGLSHDEFDARMDVVSNACFSCGARAAGVERYSQCGGCHLVAYCGKACQKEDWKKRHKAECRPAKSFREGDLVVVAPIRTTHPAGADEEVTVVCGIVAGDVVGGKASVKVNFDTIREFEAGRLRRLPPRAAPPPP